MDLLRPINGLFHTPNLAHLHGDVDLFNFTLALSVHYAYEVFVFETHSDLLGFEFAYSLDILAFEILFMRELDLDRRLEH